MHEVEQHMLSKVVDEESFVGFVRYLANQRLELERMARDGTAKPTFLSGLGDWEYDSLGGYLDAVAACHEDGGGYDDDAPDDNPWRRAARILLHGKYYE